VSHGLSASAGSIVIDFWKSVLKHRDRDTIFLQVLALSGLPARFVPTGIFFLFPLQAQRSPNTRALFFARKSGVQDAVTIYGLPERGVATGTCVSISLVNLGATHIHFHFYDSRIWRKTGNDDQEGNNFTCS